MKRRQVRIGGRTLGANAQRVMSQSPANGAIDFPSGHQEQDRIHLGPLLTSPLHPKGVGTFSSSRPAKALRRQRGLWSPGYQHFAVSRLSVKTTFIYTSRQRKNSDFVQAMLERLGIGKEFVYKTQSRGCKTSPYISLDNIQSCR